MHSMLHIKHAPTHTHTHTHTLTYILSKYVCGASVAYATYAQYVCKEQEGGSY